MAARRRSKKKPDNVDTPDERQALPPQWREEFARMRAEVAGNRKKKDVPAWLVVSLVVVIVMLGIALFGTPTRWRAMNKGDEAMVEGRYADAYHQYLLAQESCNHVIARGLFDILTVNMSESANLAHAYYGQARALEHMAQEQPAYMTYLYALDQFNHVKDPTPEDTEATAYVIYRIATIKSNRGEAKEAEAAYLKLISLEKERHVQQIPNNYYALGLSDLGDLYLRRKVYDRAVSMFDKAVKAYSEEKEGGKQERMAECMIKMAEAKIIAGNVTEARDTLSDAKRVLDQALGYTDSWIRALLFGQMGAASNRTEGMGHATTFLKQAHDMVDRVMLFGCLPCTLPCLSNAARVVNSLVQVAQYLNQPYLAVEYAKHEYALTEELHGRLHKQTLSAIMGVADTLRAVKQYKEADLWMMLVPSYVIFRWMEVPNDSAEAETLQKLLDEMQGDNQPWFRLMIELHREHTLDSPKKAHNTVSKRLSKQFKMIQEAHMAIQYTVSIIEKNPEGAQKDFKAILDELDSVSKDEYLHYSLQPIRAMATLNQALSTSLTIHRSIASSLSSSMPIPIDESVVEGVVQHAEQAMEVTKGIFGKYHKNTGLTYLVVAKIYAYLHRFDEARKYLRNSKLNLERVLPPDTNEKIFAEYRLAHKDILNIINIYSA